MKKLALLCMLFLPLATWAQKQYYLPTATPSDDEKDKPMIEVYLPQQPNGRSSESYPSLLEDGRVATDEGEANYAPTPCWIRQRERRRGGSVLT